MDDLEDGIFGDFQPYRPDSSHQEAAPTSPLLTAG